MRKINSKIIEKAVAQLCIKANTVLRLDVLTALKKAYSLEKKPRAKDALAAIIANARIARKESLAICQDTGLPCVFVEIGQDVKVVGDLKKAINNGVETGYKKGFLRNSIVRDVFLRNNPGYKPAVIHFDVVAGNKLKLTVLPKGFGCENKSQLSMLLPTAGAEEVKQFVVDCIKAAGPDACPPYIVGVGIGATAEYVCFLAKKALLKKVTRRFSKFEKDLLVEINKLNIGVMGFGGKATCLGVNILTHPTHIAGMPVAVSISCHALRSATKTL